jgi:2-keto-4-pentenoate hydratase
MALTPTTPELTATTNTVARRLENAARTGIPCAPVRDLIGESDITLAYAVQRRGLEDRQAAGARVVGQKIGLTSAAVQIQLGVDQPDFGVLLDDMDVSGLDEVPSDRLLQPKAEAEIAFVLATDLDDPDLNAQKVRTAVDYALAAIEIVDSRIQDWDIRITDTIADNASSGLYVLGDQRLKLSDFAPAEVTMRLYVDDALVSEGTGAACLGDPINALLWLARIAQDFGEPLRAGQVILSGALGPMVPAPPGSTIRAEISPFGSVTATFSIKDNS